MNYENKPQAIEDLEAKDLGIAEVVEVEQDARKPESLRQLREDAYKQLDKQVCRKVDLIILPIIGILYILNYIDRQNLGATKVQGIMVDLNLTTTQFATCISILFVGYLPFQIPSNLLITKVARPGLYICCAVVIWGAISASCAAARNYKDLVAIRAILGAVEAVFFPGAIYYMSSWYNKQELGKRLGWLYIAQQVGNAFGGLFAAAVLKLNNVHGLKGWQWLFIIEGSATVGIGGAAAFFMPEYPHSARMLSPIQRDMAVWRLAKETGSAEVVESPLKSFVDAFKDPKLYFLIGMNLLLAVLGSISNFFPSIVQSLGYDSTKTLLLTAPPYIFAGFMYYLISWYSDRKNSIYPVMMVLISIACALYVLAIATTNIGARYFAMMCMPFASIGPQILLYKTVNLHLPRPVAKRSAATALVSAIGGTSNVWISYLWIGSPHYYIPFGTLLGCAIAFLGLITAYRLYVRKENVKLERAQNGDAAAIAELTRTGITMEMIDFGWRYEMW